MIEHLVWFKLRADAPEAAKERLLAELVALKDRIPGILDASAGADFSGRAAGYTHGFVVRFVDRAALEAYHPHPAHRTVVEQHVEPISEGVLALDYEHD
ncbi:MAG: Dabb family protein [Proteobacteria bacterium]|nr:Dabb family protein [Pseudomonadota bacterium]